MSEQPTIRCVFGMRGYGKTTLAKMLSTDCERFMAHDVFREYEGLHFDDLFSLGKFFDESSLEQFRVCFYQPDYEEDFCAAAWVIGNRIQPRRLTLLLEEADLVAAPGREPPIVKRLIAQGRHVGIDMISCSRRPAEVSRLLTSQAEEFYLFKIQEPKDLTYLRSFIPADRVAELPLLEKFEYLHVSGGGVKKCVLPPPPGTTSSSRGRNAENT